MQNAKNGKQSGRDNALRVAVVGEEDQRAEILPILQRISEPDLEVFGIPSEAVQSQSAQPSDVAMVVVGNEDALQYLQTLAQADTRPLLFALVRDRSSQLMRRALRSGADEILFTPLDPGDATRALLKVSETRRRTERTGRGEVCSVVSVTGGAGVTTVAANLALALRYAAHKQVAVVDLDLQSADLAVTLNLEPEHTLMDLAEASRKLDSMLLESALVKHPSGLYLLAAPKRIEDGERVGAERIGAALDLMTQLFDFVVVDIGRHLDENSVMVWEHSDHLYYILDQSIAAVRCAWRFLDLLSRLNLTSIEPAFVLNQFNTRQVISPEQIVNTLARPLATQLPRDDKNVEQCLVNGKDLWQTAPNSPLCKSMDEWALTLAGSPPATTERNGHLLSRLFAAVGVNTQA